MWSLDPQANGDSTGRLSCDRKCSCTYGTKIKLIRLDIDLRQDGEDSETHSRWNLQATASENPDLSSKDAGERVYRGPLEWFQAVRFRVTLVSTSNSYISRKRMGKLA